MLNPYKVMMFVIIISSPMSLYAFESYDDHLLALTKESPNFAGVYKDKNGNLVVALAQSHPQLRGHNAVEKNQVHATYAKAKMFLGDKLMSNLEKKYGKDRFNYKKKFISKINNFGRSISVEFEEKIATRLVRFSFLDLHKWYQMARADLFKFEGVVGSDIDEVSNNIVVHIDSNIDNDYLKSNLDGVFLNYGIPSSAYSYQESSLASTDLTLQNRASIASGGLQIFRMAGTIMHRCTLGFITSINNIRGFLTNSHCTSRQGVLDDGTIFFQGNFSDNIQLGSPTLESANLGRCDGSNIRNCYNTDIAFIPIDEGVPSNESVLKSKAINSKNIEIKTGKKSVWATLYLPEEVNLGNRAAVMVGDAVFKTGRTTGTTSGVVTSTCIDRNVGLYNMYRCQMEVKGDRGRFSDSGDSGSAVLGSILGTESFAYTYPYSYKARALGVLWGSSSNDGEYSYFSDIEAIQQEIGDFDSL